MYALGAVKPWVKDAANDIGTRFSVATIYGVGARPDLTSDHPAGLALDFMVYSDRVKGDAIANYVQANYARLSVKYVIWRQRIWNPLRASEGWRIMPDRGSITANHFDHVHVSFNDQAGSLLPAINIPNPLAPLGDAVKALQSLGAVLKFLTDSHNWLRVGEFILGAMLIISGILRLGLE